MKFPPANLVTLVFQGIRQVYHYWFEVTDSNPARDGRRILCTDPFAHTVDWRLKSDRLTDPYTDDDRDPAESSSSTPGR